MTKFTFEDLFKEIDILTDKEGFVELTSIKEILMITPKQGAVLLKFDTGEEKWIPKSTLRVDEDSKVWVELWKYKQEF